MKLLLAVFFALLMPAAALAATADQPAIDAAKAWLVLVDAGDYAQSWNAASQFLQSRVTEAQWETVGKAARDPLGAVVGRNAASVKFSATLPGAPDGRYALVEFDTRFAHKAAATESVVMTMEGGIWKTAGYSFK
jgi:hypothetical protein